MIRPFNIHMHNQGEGAPIFDRCTTIRVFDTQSMMPGTEARVMYDGWSFCPFGRWGVLKAFAVTWIRHMDECWHGPRLDRRTSMDASDE